MSSSYILYDPRNNLSTPITYIELQEITGLPMDHLSSIKSKKNKVTSIGCYFLNSTATLAERKAMYQKFTYKDEAFVEINGSDGKYLISQYGRVKRIYKKSTKLLLPFLRKQNGSMYVKVKFQDVHGTYKLSHLVAHHFIGKRTKGRVIRHKNGIKTDDYSGNLEYISRQKLGKMTGYTSKSKPVVQLNEDGEIIGEYRSAREAGRECYISYQTVLDYCNGIRTRNPLYHLMFENDYIEKFGDVE